MPIMMQHIAGRCCPVVICDHCNTRIEKATNGNVLWLVTGGPIINDGNLWFTHKQCTLPFEKSNPPGDGCHHFISGLEVFWVQFADNIELDIKQAKQNAMLLGLIE